MPSNATNKNIFWQSSNNSVAFVNESSGIVTAKAEGSATIYAIAQDGSGQRGACVITVPQRVGVTSVSVSPSTLTINSFKEPTLVVTSKYAVPHTDSDCPNEQTTVEYTYNDNRKLTEKKTTHSYLNCCEAYDTTVAVNISTIPQVSLYARKATSRARN